LVNNVTKQYIWIDKKRTVMCKLVRVCLPALAICILFKQARIVVLETSPKSSQRRTSVAILLTQMAIDTIVVAISTSFPGTLTKRQVQMEHGHQADSIEAMATRYACSLVMSRTSGAHRYPDQASVWPSGYFKGRLALIKSTLI